MARARSLRPLFGEQADPNLLFLQQPFLFRNARADDAPGVDILRSVRLGERTLLQHLQESEGPGTRQREPLLRLS